jgi:type IV fimbrial biogenesis protein FimT
MKFCRGFTLLELMVTVAVLAILLTVGVPSFRDLIQNNRVTTQTNELVTALNFARAEAVKRGRSVQVEVLAQEVKGWTVTVALANPDGADDLRVVDRQGSAITVLEDATVTFDATGAPNDSIAFVMQPETACSGNKSRLISVGLSGQMTTIKQDCQ